MFFKLGNIIVHLCGYAGAASYVRETTVSRCQLFSNYDFQIIMAVSLKGLRSPEQKNGPCTANTCRHEKEGREMEEKDLS